MLPTVAFTLCCVLVGVHLIHLTYIFLINLIISKFVYRIDRNIEEFEGCNKHSSFITILTDQVILIRWMFWST